MLNQQKENQTLWCLPYDTESLFKPFLKVSFSYYLNNLISSIHFSAYQEQMSKQINDRHEWNQKCWALIQFFQFINKSFELNDWDDHIQFIEDTTLRKTLGYFRLWIDAERLYLFNFLKLDSSQFQEDRIFLSLFRVLIYFNQLFTQYQLKDFSDSFIKDFFYGCVKYLTQVNNTCNNQTKQVVELIVKLLQNIRRRNPMLVDPARLNSIKKSAKIKVTQEESLIPQVEARLVMTCKTQDRRNQSKKTKLILNISFIEDMSKNIESTYDPIVRITQENQQQIFMNEKLKQEKLTQQILRYKSDSRRWPITESNVYNSLSTNNHNPYSNTNYLIYGEDTKVDMQRKKILEKIQQTQIVSREEDDETKMYYEDKFQRQIQEVDGSSCKVTVKDLNMNAGRRNTDAKDRLKDKDSSAKVYNLRWLKDPSSSDRKWDNQTTGNQTKDYGNNILFKSPLDDNLHDRNRRKMEKLMQQRNCTSMTVANYEEMCDQIHPESVKSSFGATLFIKKQPQILDVKNWKLVNQNKFDFMRKVIGYMTAQKKIRAMLADKNIPEYYPRGWFDFREEWYDPNMVEEKLKFAMGRSEVRGKICLW